MLIITTHIRALRIFNNSSFKAKMTKRNVWSIATSCAPGQVRALEVEQMYLMVAFKILGFLISHTLWRAPQRSTEDSWTWKRQSHKRLLQLPIMNSRVNTLHQMITMLELFG